MKLYELAYACRLYKEVSGRDTLSGYDAAYRTMRERLGQSSELASDTDLNALMGFLNQWGCRIPKANFPRLKGRLRNWARSRLSQLPSGGRNICELSDEERRNVGNCYDQLVSLGAGLKFQHSAVAKTLHALRPYSLPIWDKPIKGDFERKDKLRRGSAQLYSDFIADVVGQIEELEQDVQRLKHTREEIPRLVGRDEQTSLVKLVDEYRWITITLGHVIPRHGEFKRWLDWIP
jgi:hypothetical protein